MSNTQKQPKHPTAMFSMRIPLYQFNRLTAQAISDNTSISKVLKGILDKSDSIKK